MVITSRKKALLGSFVFILLLISLSATIFLTQRPQRYQSSAAELEAELEEKPLSTLCAERNSQAITPFDECHKRLSPDPNNPLYYCCQ